MEITANLPAPNSLPSLKEEAPNYKMEPERLAFLLEYFNDNREKENKGKPATFSILNEWEDSSSSKDSIKNDKPLLIRASSESNLRKIIDEKIEIALKTQIVSMQITPSSFDNPKSEEEFLKADFPLALTEQEAFKADSTNTDLYKKIKNNLNISTRLNDSLQKITLQNIDKEKSKFLVTYVQNRLDLVKRLVEKKENSWIHLLTMHLNALNASKKQSKNLQDEAEFSCKDFLKHYYMELYHTKGKIFKIVNLIIGGPKASKTSLVLKHFSILSRTDPFRLSLKKLNLELTQTINFLSVDTFHLRRIENLSKSKVFNKNLREVLILSVYQANWISCFAADVQKYTKDFCRGVMLNCCDFTKGGNKLKLNELLAIEKTNEIKTLLETIHSSSSPLLLFFQLHLKEARQVLFNYSENQKALTSFAKELAYVLDALIQPTQENFIKWQAEYLWVKKQVKPAPRGTALEIFYKILTHYENKMTPITKILPLVLTGSTREPLKNIIDLLAEWKDKKTALSLWRRLFDVVVSKHGNPIHEKYLQIFHKNLEKHTFPQLITYVNDNTFRSFFANLAPSKNKDPVYANVIPSLITVNRHPIKLSYEDSPYQVQRQFFKLLLNEINISGFNEEITEEEQEEQVEEFISNLILSPLLTALLGFGSISWDLLGREAINEIYPKLNGIGLKRFALRKIHDKNEIHYVVHTPQNFSGMQRLKYHIYERTDKHDANSFAIDQERPLVELHFDWMGCLEEIQKDPPLFKVKGVLRLTHLSETIHVTDKQMNEIHKALNSSAF